MNSFLEENKSKIQKYLTDIQKFPPLSYGYSDSLKNVERLIYEKRDHLYEIMNNEEKYSQHVPLKTRLFKSVYKMIECNYQTINLDPILRLNIVLEKFPQTENQELDSQKFPGSIDDPTIKAIMEVITGDFTLAEAILKNNMDNEINHKVIESLVALYEHKGKNEYMLPVALKRETAENVQGEELVKDKSVSRAVFKTYCKQFGVDIWLRNLWEPIIYPVIQENSYEFAVSF